MRAIPSLAQVAGNPRRFGQEAALKKAIAIAPRGRRAMELLNISVGRSPEFVPARDFAWLPALSFDVVLYTYVHAYVHAYIRTFL